MIRGLVTDDSGKFFYSLRPGTGDRKIGGFSTFAEVLELLHPRLFLTAAQFGRLRKVWAEQRAIRLAS